jgi:hypothetical protein
MEQHAPPSAIVRWIGKGKEREGNTHRMRREGAGWERATRKGLKGVPRVRRCTVTIRAQVWRLAELVCAARAGHFGDTVLVNGCLFQ